MSANIFSGKWKCKAPPSMRIAGGFALLLVGGVLALPGVPGPGIAVILLGLWVLSDHFTWAKRSLAWVKQKTDRIRGIKCDGDCSQ